MKKYRNDKKLMERRNKMSFGEIKEKDKDKEYSQELGELDGHRVLPFSSQYFNLEANQENPKRHSQSNICFNRSSLREQSAPLSHLNHSQYILPPVYPPQINMPVTYPPQTRGNMVYPPPYPYVIQVPVYIP